MAVGDVYRVLDYQSMFGSQMLNVYYYEQVAAFTPDINESESFIQDWFTDMQPAILEVQNDIVTHPVLTISSLASFTDFWSTTNGGSGQVSGDCLPPFVAWAIRLNRVSRVVRNGQKRFAGVSESQQENGIVISGTPTTNLTLLAEKLATIIDHGGVPTWKPIIARIGPGDSVTAQSDVAGATFVGISSQATRKYGRGM